MDVICHQHISMNGAIVAIRRILETIEKKAVIFLGGKNNTAVIAAQDDMLRLAGQIVAGKSCHGRVTGS